MSCPDGRSSRRGRAIRCMRSNITVGTDATALCREMPSRAAWIGERVLRLFRLRDTYDGAQEEAEVFFGRCPLRAERDLEPQEALCQPMPVLDGFRSSFSRQGRRHPGDQIRALVKWKDAAHVPKPPTHPCFERIMHGVMPSNGSGLARGLGLSFPQQIGRPGRWVARSASVGGDCVAGGVSLGSTPKPGKRRECRTAPPGQSVCG